MQVSLVGLAEYRHLLPFAIHRPVNVMRLQGRYLSSCGRAKSQLRRVRSIVQAMSRLPAVPVVRMKRVWSKPVGSKAKAGNRNFPAMVKIGWKR